MKIELPPPLSPKYFDSFCHTKDFPSKSANIIFDQKTILLIHEFVCEIFQSHRYNNRKTMA